MSRPSDTGALDRFRLLAALLVVTIHTSPLTSYTPLGDWFLTRVLARVAVPFFLMTSGYFLARDSWRGMGRFLKRNAMVYGAAVLLYLPLNLYNGGFSGVEWLKRLFLDGTFYHLWYFPALLLGVPIAYGLSKLGRGPALAAAGVLYLIGLGGDSYYGLAVQIPALQSLYDGIFAVFAYTRNGLFLAPLFLLLGSMGRRGARGPCAAGLAASFALMTAEGFWLRSLESPRHDSMYLLLPVCMVFLFRLLLSLGGRPSRSLRSLALWIYLLHPWCIVLVRGAARAAGLEGLLIANSLGHFCAVLTLSALLAWGLEFLRPRRPNPTDRAWRELDRAALTHNIQQLQGALAPGCALMAVVKADAYGHGAVPVARACQRAGVRAFAVACLSEGIQLRRAGIWGTILILGETPAREVPLLRRWQLTQMVADAEHGWALAAQGEKVHVHLALDTGMHRLGIPWQAKESIAALYRQKNLRIEGVCSHLCVSDETSAESDAYTDLQLERFYDTVRWMEGEGLTPGKLHIQASYGILNLPPQPCAYARAGIALYGVLSQSGAVRHPLDLRPVLTLRARVVSVRVLAPGETAGYGRAFRAERTTTLAVIAVGYGDGLPRALTAQGGAVLIRGRRCPMAGRMCMDQLLVDVTGVEGVRPGDVATLIGRDGAENIPAEAVAARCGTITNELLAQLGERLPTVWKT